MNNSVFGKTMENVRSHKYIKLVAPDKQKNKLMPVPNYHTTKHFSGKLAAIKMNKINVKMNKSAYLGLPVLDITKITIYKYCYDHVKPKYENKVKLCYMDTESLIVFVKLKNIHADLAGDVKKRFGTSNYEVNRTLPIGRSKKGLMKDELGGKIIKEF